MKYVGDGEVVGEAQHVCEEESVGLCPQMGTQVLACGDLLHFPSLPASSCLDVVHGQISKLLQEWLSRRMAPAMANPKGPFHPKHELLF